MDEVVPVAPRRTDTSRSSEMSCRRSRMSRSLPTRPRELIISLNVQRTLEGTRWAAGRLEGRGGDDAVQWHDGALLKVLRGSDSEGGGRWRARSKNHPTPRRRRNQLSPALAVRLRAVAWRVAERERTLDELVEESRQLQRALWQARKRAAEAKRA